MDFWKSWQNPPNTQQQGGTDSSVINSVQGLFAGFFDGSSPAAAASNGPPGYGPTPASGNYANAGAGGLGYASNGAPQVQGAQGYAPPVTQLPPGTGAQLPGAGAPQSGQSGAGGGDSFYGYFSNLFSKEDGAAALASQSQGSLGGSLPQRGLSGHGEPAQTASSPSRGRPRPVLPGSGGNQYGSPVERQGAATGSSSPLNSSSPLPSKPTPYVGDPDDLLDQHVAYNLRQNPEVAKRIQIVRKQPAVYDLNGREIRVEWQYSETPGGQGQLICLDGPTRQPFSEYIKRMDSVPFGGYGPTNGAPTPSVSTRQGLQDQGGLSADKLTRSTADLPREVRKSHQSSSAGKYVADPEDLLDQHVAYYCKHHPEVYKKVPIVRKRPGIYEIMGREIQVEWQYATTPGGQGFLVVIDGPMRQPFADYMQRSEANAEYNGAGLERGLLAQIPQERRLTFGDQQNVYSRLDAMKVAKAQAQFREKAADYVQQGVEVPADLMHKYEKTLQQKLGNNKQRSRMRPNTNQAAAPAATQVGTAGTQCPGQPLQAAAGPVVPSGQRAMGSAANRGMSPVPSAMAPQTGYSSPRNAGYMEAQAARARSPQPQISYQPGFAGPPVGRGLSGSLQPGQPPMYGAPGPAGPSAWPQPQVSVMQPAAGQAPMPWFHQ